MLVGDLVFYSIQMIPSVYLGGYDIKYWGSSTHINFSLKDYEQEFEGTKNMTRQEYVAHLRRKSSGFSRGASIYRGVTRNSVKKHIKMASSEDGKLGSVELQETRTFILEPSVSSILQYTTNSVKSIYYAVSSEIIQFPSVT